MAFAVLLTSIAFILVAIIVLKLHPFLALILTAILVGLLSPRPLLEGEVESARRQLEKELREGVESGALSRENLRERLEGVRWRVEAGKRAPKPIQALELTAVGFGTTAGSIGIVILLAAIIGQCLMESGAADKIVRRFLGLLGEERAGISLLSSGYLLSIPVFFDTVFFLLVPLARALRLGTGKNYVLYICSICAGAAITHSLVPPTPGPLVMADTLGLDLGLAIAGGALLGLLPALFGLVLSGRVNRKLEVPFRDAAGPSRKELEAVVSRKEQELPGFFVSALPVLLPVVLITGHSLIDALAKADLAFAPVTAWTGFFGNKNMALLLASFIAAAVLVREKQLSLSELGRRLEPAIASAGVIILITSAGGAFGQMLSRIGIDETLRQIPSGEGGLSFLFLAWGMAAVMKIAQGSGTVSMITTSAIMVAILPDASALPYHPIYIFAAIGFGSGFISWMNDSAFWVVCKMSGFTEGETLRTWTFVLGAIGVVGLVEVVLLASVLPLV